MQVSNYLAENLTGKGSHVDGGHLTRSRAARNQDFASRGRCKLVRGTCAAPPADSGSRTRATEMLRGDIFLERDTRHRSRHLSSIELFLHVEIGDPVCPGETTCVNARLPRHLGKEGECRFSKLG